MEGRHFEIDFSINLFFSKMKINKNKSKINSHFLSFDNLNNNLFHDISISCFSPPEHFSVNPFVFINGSDFLKKSLDLKVKNSPPALVYSVENVNVVGHGLIVNSEGDRLLGHGAIPEVGRLEHGFNKKILLDKGGFFEFKGELGVKYIDEKIECAILSQAGQGVYGHWLVDILPKISLMEACGFDGKYVLHKVVPDFGWDLIDKLGIKKNRFILFDPVNEYISISKALIPGGLRAGNSFSRVSLFAFERFRRYGVKPSLDKKIYVSRGGLKRKNQIIENRSSLENLAVKNGFEIIRPEEKSISDQIKIFSSAKFIAGEYGSAMHNSIFSSPSCKVLVFQSSEHPYFMQAGLCSVIGQSIGFVFGNAEKNSRNFSVNLSDAEAAFELMK